MKSRPLERESPPRCREMTEKAAKLKRRSETEGEEPQAKKGSITSGSEVVKPVELKPATSVSTAMPSGKDKGTQEAKTVTVVSEKKASYAEIGHRLEDSRGGTATRCWGEGPSWTVFG